ncbi:MAG: hypothetical protein Q7R35_03160 [Elusimicrobiota bacterium]|nr:hypothetical protein [Elusimicrobiota bacterium]
MLITTGARAQGFTLAEMRAADITAAGATAMPAVTPSVYAGDAADKAVRQSKTVFEIKPFTTAPSSSEEVKKGLKDLYKGGIEGGALDRQAQKSLDFQDRVYTALNAQLALDKNWPVTVSEKRLAGNFVRETTVRFPSLVQRPGGHASNMVVARIYEPAVKRPYCDYKYPATIILHHILNEVELIEDLGKILSAGVLGQPAVFVVIQMPHYSERRQGGEEFLNSDLNNFRGNMAQLILDVHLLKNYLETRDNISSKKLSLSGLSLGSVMGLTVGAFDQGFNGYGFLVGGVDLANIIMNRSRNRPDSEIAVALRDLNPDEGFLRDELAAVDGMTWLHRYRGKKMFLQSATRDDIVDFKNSVEPMAALLRSQDNNLTQKINNDEHTPTAGVVSTLRNVFLPLLKFVVDGSPRLDAVCPVAVD